MKKGSFVFALLLGQIFTGAFARMDADVTRPDTATVNTEADTARQKRASDLQKEHTIKRWRKLATGMTEQDVRKILGKPKLIQGGSDTSVWYYQVLPTAYSRAGAVVFRALTIEDLVRPESEKYWAVKLKLMGPSGVVGGQEGPSVDSFDKKMKVRLSALEKNYERRIRQLKDERIPRDPVFVLNHFVEPDWDNIEELIEQKGPAGKPKDTGTPRWNNPVAWQKLKINMTQADALMILGEPTESRSNIKGTTLWYGDSSEYGILTFSPRSDSGLRLDFWTEPFWLEIE
jgi:hypothetical protein